MGCAVVPLAIGMVILFSVIGAVRSCDTSSFKDAIDKSFNVDPSIITLSGSASVLPATDGDGDVVVVTQKSEDSTTTRRLSRIAFTPNGSVVRWESEPLDSSASRVEVALVGDRLFAGYDDHLLALDAATGKTAWSGTLHDKLTIGCPDCFSAVRGRLIVRTTDAYVTAYGKASSESLWSRRLNATNGSISVAGGRLFVVDDPEDASQTTPVALVDPANGRTIRAVRPTCPKGDNFWDVEMAPGDPVRPVPNTTDVVAAFGFGDGCVVRWAPDTGAVKWTSRLTGLSSFDQDDTVVGDHDLVLNGSGALVEVDLSSGVAGQLPLPADVAASPGVIVGRTYVANSVTSRGTPRGGLIGYDLAAKKRIWASQSLGTAQPVSTSRYHSSDALFDGSSRSLLVPVDQGTGVNVFVFDGDPHRFTVRSLDVATGDLGAQIQRAYETRYEDSGTPSLTIEDLESSRLLVSVDNLLQTIPSSGKGDIVTYPNKD